MFLQNYLFLNRVPCYLRFSRNQSVGPSYLHNPGSEPLTYSSFGKVLEDTANKYPNRVAVRSIHEDLTITYEELLNQADSMGHALRNNGFQKGDRLGIWCHNCTGWIIALIAAARAGLISVLINPTLEAPELSYCINKTELKGIVFGNKIHSRNYYNMLQQIIPELNNSKPGYLVSKMFPTLTTLISNENHDLDGAFPLRLLANEHKNNNNISEYLSQIKPEDGSTIHFTSGTTGKPKAGLDSNLGIVNNTYFSGLRCGLHEENQKICVQLPMFHGFGSIITVMGGLRHGSTLVIPSPIYSVRANINALCSEKCTVVTGTPTMYVDLLSQIRKTGTLPNKFQIALVSGAPCSPQLVHQMHKEVTSSVKSMFGMTETSGAVFQSLQNEREDKVAQTVGYVHDHVEVKVVDENGNTVPFGETGELMVRGYLKMISYWNDPEKTKETINEDGWVRTGDKFKLSPDGYGFFVGRFKELIVSGGEKIAPKEVEDLLNDHPDIIESQVVGIADERLGEEICAVVRIRDGVKISLEDITSYLAGKIAKYKIPKSLKIIDVFPKTTSGKIRRNSVREIIISSNSK